MCTLSWFKTGDGYELFFNRDELNERQKADAPKVYLESGVTIISPTDTDAGGTWISVNQFGLSFCLLNHYEKEYLATQRTSWTSRGEIIRQLSILGDLASIEKFIQNMDFSQYKPFRLFVLNDNAHSLFFTWDGRAINCEYDVKTPRSSSSFDTENVRQGRKALFQTLGLLDISDRQNYLDYHKSHLPERSAYSVCMHRDNAATVSFSHIVVTHNDVQFAYADGAPCEVPLEEPLLISRVNSAAINAA